MKKSLTLLVCLIVICCSNSAIAQDEFEKALIKDSKKDLKAYNMLSLDGKQAKVWVSPDYVRHTLIISCGKSVIKLSDYWGVPPKVEILHNNFMEIDYAVRGGTNLGLGNRLLVCVSDERLYEAMHILEHSSWDSGDLKINYSVAIALAGANQSDYKLKVSVHDDVDSKTKPEQNYNYNNQSVLAFDSRRHAFYSIKQNVYDRFDEATKQKIAGNFPVIFLGKEVYYLINNRWYQAEDGNKLFEFK